MLKPALISSFVCFGIYFCLAIQALAAPPVLELPIRCTLGRDCFIQNYFDHDPGPAAHDYSCGTLTYDGHHGTDFRLRDLAAMRTGVEVLASAAGTVAGVRDGEPDMNMNKRGKSSLKGREAGNGVRIDHGDGWETQYSHLLSGSVRVRNGQRVKSGDVLGMVGLSGNTEFPHVDFTVRKNGKALDPFNPEAAACGKTTLSLWSGALRPKLRYQASGLLLSGFATSPPIRETAEAGGYEVKTISADAGHLAFWTLFFGLQKGDRLTLELSGIDGRQISRSESTVPGDKAVWFAYSGKRRKGTFWPKGSYAAVVLLERAGKTVIRERREIEVR